MAWRSRRTSSNSARARSDQGAAPGLEGGPDSGAAEDQAAGRKIRAWHDAHQVFERHSGIGDQRQGGIDDLAGIVRRDVGRHADRDAVRAIDQQVGEARGQHPRLFRALVIVRLEIDRVLVDVGQQHRAGTREPHFRVAHRRRRIAVHRAEIALPVDQRHAHREGLRHAHHGVVDRRVPVRMVFAHHVADHAGGFAIGLVGRVARLLHGEQDAPVHRLQAVPRVRQRAGDDDGHRIVEVGAAHLLLERDRLHVPALAARRLGRRTGGRIVGRVAQDFLSAISPVRSRETRRTARGCKPHARSRLS